MEYVNISTTQNIDLEYKIAGVGDRILAYGFDLLVLISWTVIWSIVIMQTGGYKLWHIIFTIPLMFYTLVSELFLNGQTFGKMVLKIKVAKLDGSELTLGNCLIRWMLRIIDVWIFSGSVAIISIVASNRSQRLGDLATGTTVVKTSRKNLFEETTYMEIPDDYVTVYPQSYKLTDEDAASIKEVLNFVELKNDTGTEVEYPMQLKLQNALKQKLGITNVHGSAKTFLEDILKDFNFLNK